MTIHRGKDGAFVVCNITGAMGKRVPWGTARHEAWLGIATLVLRVEINNHGHPFPRMSAPT